MYCIYGLQYVQSLGNTGTVTGIDADKDFEVTYPSGNKWTFNPAVLNKLVDNIVNDVSSSLSSLPTIRNASLNSNDANNFLEMVHRSDKSLQEFQVDDIVQICSDNEKMKIIQKGHGEWAEPMQSVSLNIFYIFYLL